MYPHCLSAHGSGGRRRCHHGRQPFDPKHLTMVTFKSRAPPSLASPPKRTKHFQNFSKTDEAATILLLPPNCIPRPPPCIPHLATASWLPPPRGSPPCTAVNHSLAPSNTNTASHKTYSTQASSTAPPTTPSLSSTASTVAAAPLAAAAYTGRVPCCLKGELPWSPPAPHASNPRVLSGFLLVGGALCTPPV